MTSKVAEVTELRQQMLNAAKAIIKAGAISRSGHGNMSMRIPGTDSMVLTSVSNLDGLSGEMLPVVTFDGKVLDGHLDPTSAEIVGMHAVVYQRSAQMGAVIHTHAPFATAYAVANRPIECWYEGLARFGLTDPISVAKYGPRGSQESIGNIADVIREKSRAVLLQDDAVQRALQKRVLLGVDGAHAVAIHHQAANFEAVRQPARRAVVAGGEDALVLGHHRADVSARAGRAQRHFGCDAHEVGVPVGTM